MDFDVIVCLTSIFTMQKRAGLTVLPREGAFHTYGFIGTPSDRQSPGGHQYENFLAGMKRLAATQITLGDQSFPWLEAFDVLTAGDHEANLATTARLPEFFWCQIAPALVPKAVLRQATAYAGTPEKLRSDVRKAVVPGYTLTYRQERHGQPYALHIDPV